MSNQETTDEWAAFDKELNEATANEIKSFISEHYVKKSVILEKAKELKLYFDVAVCECGVPEKDTDGVILTDELLSLLK